MPTITAERVASLIQRELAPIVNEVIKDNQIGYINLTEVRVTKDLSYATIFYTILTDDQDIIKKSAAELEKCKPTIRMELAKKIRNFRRIPDLIFKYDEALAYGNHIDKLLKQVK